MKSLTVTTAANRRSSTGSKASRSPKHLLDAFERIVELAKESALTADFFTAAKSDINYVARRLDLTVIQSVLLAIFIDRSEDTRIRPSEIAGFLGIGTIRMLRYFEEIDGLANKGYIRTSTRRDDRTYRVPPQALKALRLNSPLEFHEQPITDTQEFFDRFKVLAKDKDNDEIDYDQFSDQTTEMLDEIKDTVFARTLSRYNLSNDAKMLFIFMAHLYVENNDDNIRFHDLEDLYDDEEIPGHIKRDLRAHDHTLFEHGLIENVNEDGVARSDAFKLSDKAKEELLAELAIQNIGKSDKDLIKPDSISKKFLIYNSEEESSVNELSAILTDKRFKEVQARLEESGMRRGFCCIFYGAPGTGKTETVYQLAKTTGRNIMQVDVDKIKSCWVGESEKNIKALFNRYRNICRSTDKAPILLFNEADAVLGTRIEGASRAVDKMENSIQNIILQEMEKLEGIMIATTNLSSNLDKAFERRFLYKIKFNKPTSDSRAKIWKTMLPSLTTEQSKHLAAKFDLSGGEIENVVRKHTVNSILKGSSVIDIPQIEYCCSVERLSNSSSSKIGFTA
ncbi:MAG: ATP-binding protein [Duncaniella sp.]|nr:ATP-binding protein [Duncaniella sp.]